MQPTLFREVTSENIKHVTLRALSFIVKMNMPLHKLHFELSRQISFSNSLFLSRSLSLYLSLYRIARKIVSADVSDSSRKFPYHDNFRSSFTYDATQRNPVILRSDLRESKQYIGVLRRKTTLSLCVATLFVRYHKKFRSLLLYKSMSSIAKFQQDTRNLPLSFSLSLRIHCNPSCRAN